MDESDYRESEDEDYKLEQHSEEEVDSDADESVKSAIKDQNQGNERFVRTRSQKPKQEEKQLKIGESSVDVDALWAQMNAAPAKRSQTSLEDEKVTITRTFKFAGKVTTETKTVDATSAEARHHADEQARIAREKLQAQEDAQKAQESVIEPERKKRRPGPVKRKTTLAEEYAMGKAKKMNTLDKSRLDWLGFVDKQGINEDLKKHNKDGYVEKQRFLESTRR